jgi:hypothetical protein
MGWTRRIGRWFPAVPALAALMGGASLGACSGGSGDEAGGDEVITGPVDFEPTSRFLASASRRSASQPYRVDSSVSMDIAADGHEGSIDEVPIITGVQDGDRYSYELDFREFFDQFADALDEPGLPILDDYTVEAAGDAETMYVRAPLYAALVELAPPGRDTGAYGELAELGNSWGRVDRRSLDDLSMSRLQQLSGAPTSAGADPQVLLELVAGGDDVEELGTDEIDGTGVNGLKAHLSMREMVEAGGTDPDDYVEQLSADEPLGRNADPDALAALAERMLDTEMPVEVWVDGEGYVRRISQEVDLLELLGWAYLIATENSLDEYTVGATTDFADYGDETIAVELPSDSVDATDIFRSALDAGPPND